MTVRPTCPKPVHIVLPILRLDDEQRGLAQRPFDRGAPGRARGFPEAIEMAANSKHGRAAEELAHQHIERRFPERLEVAGLDLDDRRSTDDDQPRDR